MRITIEYDTESKEVVMEGGEVTYDYLSIQRLPVLERQLIIAALEVIATHLIREEQNVDTTQ